MDTIASQPPASTSKPTASLLPRLAALIAITTAAPALADKAQVEVSPKKPEAGDAVLVTVKGGEERPEGIALGESLSFFPTKKGWQALFAIPLENAPKKLDVLIQQPEQERVTVEVAERDAQKSDIEVAEAYAEPPDDAREQIVEDNRDVRNALDNEGPPQFHKPFIKPGGGKPTSGFGAVRTFNEEYRSRHLGWDLGARKGSPVKAINAGTVTLVKETYLMGNVVVIAHGAGLGSAYFHLNKVDVKEGDQIERGDRLGDAGDTGRTNGSHIHLAVWARDNLVDPQEFLDLPIRPAKNQTSL